MFTRDFWIASVERALKTFAQVLVAILGADGFDLIQADWVGTLSTVGSAVLLSFLTSIASSKTDPAPSPALFGKEHIPAAEESLEESGPEGAEPTPPPGFIVEGDGEKNVVW